MVLIFLLLLSSLIISALDDAHLQQRMTTAIQVRQQLIYLSEIGLVQLRRKLDRIPWQEEWFKPNQRLTNFFWSDGKSYCSSGHSCQGDIDLNRHFQIESVATLLAISSRSPNSQATENSQTYYIDLRSVARFRQSIIETHQGYYRSGNSTGVVDSGTNYWYEIQVQDGS